MMGNGRLAADAKRHMADVGQRTTDDGLTKYGQRVDAPAIVGMGLILAGVIVIQLFSNTKSVEPPQERGTQPAGAAAIEDP